MNKVIKKNRVVILALSIAIVATIFFFGSFTKSENMDNRLKNDTGYVVTFSPGVIFEKSLSACFEKADLIIRGKVMNVGESYLAEGYILNERDSSEVVKKNIKGIRTPVTLGIEKIYKGEDIVNSRIITVDEFYGSYSGHSLVMTNLTTLSENNEYILYIKEIDNKYYILYQPSVLLNTQSDDETGRQRGFRSLYLNELLFEDYSSSEELVNSIDYLSSYHNK
jgi:hypothetical protein